MTLMRKSIRSLGQKIKTIDIKDVFPFLGLAVVIVFFQIYSKGRVLTEVNLKAVINECFFIIIGATGFSFIIAEGNLDFSIGATMGIGCTLAAMAATVNPYLAVVASIIPGLAIGLFNGWVHTKLKVGSLITTVATQFIVNGLLVLILQGGSLAAPIDMLKWNTMTLKMVSILVIVGAGFVVFNYTAYGKYCRAVGACAEAARQTGVNDKRIKTISFMVMGGLAGLLGFYSLIRTGTATVLTGNELMMNVLCAALLGGLPLSGGAAAKFRAVIVGSLTMAFLTNGMVLMGLNTYDKQMIKGIVFLITIAISFDRKNIRVVK